MGASLRALRAFLLLAGFYLLGVVMLALLGLVDVLSWLWAPASVYLKLWIVSAVLAVPIVRGMFLLRTGRDDEPAGVLVAETDEPRLWAAVRELAEQVGTRAPDEIRLTADVNAAVSEDARLLGLLGGRRRLYLGLPLMAGLDEAQLRAVLAHELGHYSNADTRLAGMTERGRVQVVRTIAHFEEKAGGKEAKERAKQEAKQKKRLAKGKQDKEIDTGGAGITYRTMAKIYTAYARFYMRATFAGSRRQELAADLASARIAGRDATASALREIPALDAAFGFYMNAYATMGAEHGLLPPRGEVFGGVRHLLAARPDELDGLRREPPAEPASAYDSHPPTAERVARIEALPDDGRAAERAAPAFALLADVDRALAAVEDATLTPEASRMRRLQWSELVHTSMTAHFARDAEPLRQATADVTGSGTLDALLDAIDAGTVRRIVERLPRSEQAESATGRAAREFARPVLRRGLSRLVVLAFLADGRARWELSWAESAGLHLPSGVADALDAALDAAVADESDTSGLRSLLATPAAETVGAEPAASDAPAAAEARA
ncbi:M48 family metallopeptidase [Streptomyces sp. NPDC090127]|uniref:M48 family metallopeptidase n=1 Tax=Streptomyces sp. NPDC090127 TaxID=3365953 RepID=UPI00380CFA4A